MSSPGDFHASLALRVPIIQAPMAGVSSPEMAAAASNAGGLGSLGVGAMGCEEARLAIRRFRQLSSGPVNVNVFAHPPAQLDPAKDRAWLAQLSPLFRQFNAQPPKALREVYSSFLSDPDMLAMLLEERPEVVSFHFGLPSPAQLPALRQASMMLIATATNPAEARAIESAGLDGVIAQGYEAGGHRGSFDATAADAGLTTIALTRLLIRTVRLPVLAAGGIMDGAGIGAALALGAAAAVLGTAFVGTHESLASPAYRARLFGPEARHTAMTAVISGRLARCLDNDFVRWGAHVRAGDIPAYPVAYDAAKALHAAATAAGSSEFGAHWAGQGAPLARAMPVRKLMQCLEAELEASAEC